MGGQPYKYLNTLSPPSPRCSCKLYGRNVRGSVDHESRLLGPSPRLRQLNDIYPLAASSSQSPTDQLCPATTRPHDTAVMSAGKYLQIAVKFCRDCEGKAVGFSRACNEVSRRFRNHRVPRAFYWLKVSTSTFTFKTLLNRRLNMAS